MTRRFVPLWVLLFGLLCSVPASAHLKGESVHAALTSGTPSQYIFRGLVLKDKGWIGQAASDLRVDLLDSEQLRISTAVGFWLSLHPGDLSPNGAGPAAWYESRLDGGLVLGVGKLVMDGRFVVYSSPAGAFEDIYELRGQLRYDDEELWTKGSAKAIFRGIKPQLTLALEVEGARDGGESGAFAGIDIAPTLHVLEGVALSADLSFPMSLGFSAGDYYEVPKVSAATGAVVLEDQFFGYAAFGAFLDLGLGFVPERLGEWRLGGYLDAVLPVAQNAATGSKTDTVELVIGSKAAMLF